MLLLIDDGSKPSYVFAKALRILIRCQRIGELTKCSYASLQVFASDFIDNRECMESGIFGLEDKSNQLEQIRG